MPGITDPAETYFKNGLWAWDAANSTWVQVPGGTTGQAQINLDDLKATTPVVYNVTMTSANTEYSRALPANTKKFLIRCREEYAIKACFASGASGTTYITVPSGMSYWEDLIQPATLTLYFQCATAAQVAEIVAWS